MIGAYSYSKSFSFTFYFLLCIVAVSNRDLFEGDICKDKVLLEMSSFFEKELDLVVARRIMIKTYCVAS